VILLGFGGVARAQNNEPMGTSGNAPTPPATNPSQMSPGATGPDGAPGAQTLQCKDLGVTVSFTTGSSTLDVNAKGALDGVSKWMHTKDTRVLKLQGYADTTGNSTANVTLSETRADAAKNYLVDQGVDPSRIATIGRGEEHPEFGTLPNSGRTVTFIGCQPPMMADATPPAAPPETVVPPPPSTEPVAPVEETPPPPPVAAEPVPPTPPYEATPAYRYGSKIGFAFIVGGGFTDFTKSNARALTNGGGGWDARIIGGTRTFVGFEAAYVGTANNLPALGNATSTLISNGVEGALRLNVPIIVGFNMIEPYVFGGVGWANYRVTNNRPAFSDFATGSDNVMTVPAGGGVSYTYKAFTLDARASWTGTYFNNLILTPGATTNNRLDHWQAGGNIGVAF
jgi:outer membrane protein OmpA-like peptidoglycan-associated protein